MQFLWAFIVGGLICVIGQLLMDGAKLTPAHTMSTLVVAGAVADAFGIYDPLVKFAGAGATVPITSFGNSLVHGALTELERRLDWSDHRYFRSHGGRNIVGDYLFSPHWLFGQKVEF